MKFAIVSHVLPPSSSGQAIVLYRLLKDLDPESYCLISQKDYTSEAYGEGYTSKLMGRYYKIYPEPKTRDPFQFSQGLLYPLGVMLRLFNVLMAFLGIFLRGVQIARILRQEKCSAVVACTADLVNLPASYLASRLAGASYYPYIFDYYSYQWTEPTSRSFAELFEPLVLHGATGIIVPNEHLERELKRRYSVRSTVIHNPCDQAEGVGEVPWPAEDDEVKIVYTGAVYYVHYDAFRNLVSAIERLGSRNVRLHIYTGEPHNLLESEGIRGPVVYHDHVDLSEALNIQKLADVLFLPLAFHSSNPQIVNTSSPGKMGEYLASGRPILVHAPVESFVSWYFRENGCGMVVDENDRGTLAKAILEIVENESVRREMVSKAIQCAREDFSLDAVRARFFRLLDAGNPGRGLP